MAKQTKNTVKIQDGSILLNGVTVGYVSSGSEKWVTFTDAEDRQQAVARFKHHRSGTSATSWIKFILQHYTPAQLLEILRPNGLPRETPLGLAKKHGYVSPNMKAALKAKDEIEARKKLETVC
jgi:hypothetical protein